MRKAIRPSLLVVLLASAAPLQAETLNYRYDVHGRLIFVERAGGPNSGLNTQHSYDLADNRIQTRIGTGGPLTPPATSAPKFSIGNTSVTEGGALEFVVTRHGSALNAYSVSWASAPGTASSSDFTAASGTLTFSPDEYSKTVSVATVQDSLFEADETLFVNLSNPTGGATIIDAEGIGTILNDDSSNQPPVAVYDQSSANACGPRITYNVVANDYDPDGNVPLSVSAIHSVTGGTASIASSTSISFRASSAGGFGQVIYVLRDSLGATSFGTFDITIIGEGPCP